MEIEEIEKLFDQTITDFLNRVEVNDIVGTSTQFDETLFTKEDVERDLIENANSYIQVRNAVVLNDINFYSTDTNEPDVNNQPTNQSEHFHLFQNLNQVLTFLDETVEDACKKGENAYPLSNFFRDAIQLIDLRTNEMNFESWLAKKPRTKDSGYYILIGGERFFFNTIQVKFEASSLDIIKYEFQFRRNLLQKLKNSLVNIFTLHLILPDPKMIPKLKFNGDKVDINELIFVLFSSGRLENPEQAKTILLEMFEIPKNTYSKDVSYIVNKKKSSFLQELTKMLDKLKVIASDK